MNLSRPFACALAMCALWLGAAAPAAAQSYPKGVVRWIVPFPPGGPTDVVGRIVSQQLQELWGQPVVVENKPGAGTMIGTDAVAKSAPDGHTIGMVITAHMINPTLRAASMPYDTLKDLAHVTQMVERGRRHGVLEHERLHLRRAFQLDRLAVGELAEAVVDVGPQGLGVERAEGRLGGKVVVGRVTVGEPGPPAPRAVANRPAPKPLPCAGDPWRSMTPRASARVGS